MNPSTTTPAQAPVPFPLSGLLGFNAGYVDTAGFLALSGLFTAHVTGNFVTLGASLIQGTSGAAAKLSALPVFCLFVVLTRMVSNAILAKQQQPMRRLILAKTTLLLIAGIMMIALGPFPDANALPAYIAGMLMVGAMAVQNAMQRIHLPSAPPSTLMTGNTTQVMIDLTDWMKGVNGEQRAAIKTRLGKMLPAIGSFALGCALGALLYYFAGMWCFALPPVIAAASACYTPGK